MQQADYFLCKQTSALAVAGPREEATVVLSTEGEPYNVFVGRALFHTQNEQLLFFQNRLNETD